MSYYGHFRDMECMIKVLVLWICIVCRCE